MHARAMNRLQLETDLRRALERREMHVHYQPIVSLKNFNILGFEALLRWQHPERGLVSPEEFIATAEETGLIVPIGKWVISEACRQMKRWQTQLPVHPHLSISINISSKQFMQPDLIDHIKEVLRQTGINPHNLRLELTESVVMENVEKATGMLQQLREIGTGLSIDDFGTGYSSLSYLHRFPIDILKIDRSFVGCMTENNENLEIVRTIVMLAQNLGMEVVAEGVETKEQLALLTLLKCDSAQGYYFSRPTEAAAADILLLDTLPSDFNRRW
jgi:EAL domain-containing protein (putative c-di-GMP-specific phosphodiesterase class I)